ncbi:MAG TPA: TetR/AcrR family transcriptional regulator [Ktedonobacteraceae bacterium]|nr:TetR/AcrR family transcriptional regulator [Ktedonobacteraceae bacterium]
MASQRTSERSRTQERSRRAQREQRAERILDAAAELMLRWGYNKTTIDDIVRVAGVPKGTIYLHWKTREDLFLALMNREYIRLARDIQQRIASDPDGGTLQGLTKHSMLATMKSPLMKAVLLRDTDLMGEWMRKEYARPSYSEQIAQSLGLLEVYRSRGVVRDDIDVRKLVYMLDAITVGFLVIEEYMPDDFKYSDEEVAEMTAEAVKRTFAPSPTSAPEPDEQAKQELANRFISSLDNVLAIRSKLDQEEATS